MRFTSPEPAPAEFLTRKPSYPWLVVATVCVGAFIGQVDASVVQLVLPRLEVALDAPLNAVSWVALAYVLGFACALPPFARLADIAGRKLFYLSGFALFGLWSVLCGFAPDLPSLIAFRFLQGVSGAMLGANSVAILVAAAGPERRGRALGIMAAAQAIGLSLGPAAGGLIIAALDWRWVFWINAPFAVAGTLLAWLIVPKTARAAGDPRFDGPGALILAPALAAILVALSEAHAWGLTPVLIGCAAGGAALLGLFVWRELRAPAPLLDLGLFRSAAFSAGSVGVLLSYGMLYAVFLAISFALVRGFHDTALQAGLRLAIVPVALGIVSVFAGKASDTRPRLVMLAGMALCAAAAVALRTLLDGDPRSLTGVMAALAVFGAGLGGYIAPNNSATIGAAPAQKSGVAGGLINLLRQVGAGLGVAASTAVLGYGLGRAGALDDNTRHASQQAVLAGVGDVMILLVALAAVCAACALVRDARKAA